MVTHMYVQLSASISPAISSSILRFDDKPTTSVRRVKDVFVPIRVLWVLFHTNLTRYFVPGQNITVDEQMVSFRAGAYSLSACHPGQINTASISSRLAIPQHTIPYEIFRTLAKRLPASDQQKGK
ncbi:PiggyBac transposable element-derived protein 4-like protein [Plakobranchus ocellatus]|uniref:PiggyBac transposable element-derived protein 4-like protein n=1 Tax=Plakobranchus ocellatus TaxID=259542 RepID=A0AAV3Y9I7_9GAST|nr:PiggyBac transposable element-derived protein 4-like protein [Plakobranchus ocellatus]